MELNMNEPTRTIDVTDMTPAELGLLLGLPVDGDIRPEVRAAIEAFKRSEETP